MNRKLLVSIVASTLIYGAFLFVPAGTILWWRAWAFLGVIAVGTVVTLRVAFKVDTGLLSERLKPPFQRGQPLIDKIVVALLGAGLVTQLIIIPLDVFRLHLLPTPNTFVSSLGMAMLLAGWTIITLVYRENAFAAPVIKLQDERQHRVIDTGPYAIVRHPMYTGAVLFFVGMALWLESYAGAIAAALPIGTLMVRILIEERFLRQHLDGYGDYMRRVRWRLVPYVW
jgi:protein-S-isoprenylcysteine O-methyltransferase Ste14